MPIVHENRELPPWSELASFAVVDLPAGQEIPWRAVTVANKLVVVDGEVDAWVNGTATELGEGAVLDAPAGDHALTSADGATVVLIGGRWGQECGGSGVFTAVETTDPHDRGDPVDYPKRTAFDRHYHDCDEYWIIVHGRATAVTEGIHYDIGPGDCVATRMGVHHDLPLAAAPVRAVYFETTLRGQRRLGHLWEHTHGPAIPASEEGDSAR